MTDTPEQYETLLFDVRERVAHITLNRPSAGNALNVQLARDLDAALGHCRQDNEIRAVLLSGAGANFCVGGDLKMFDSLGERLPEYIGEILRHLHPAISQIAEMRAPVIAVVQGAAAGGGMSLACACDLMVAAESARFTLAYTRIGLAMDGSSSYYLPRIVGLRRATELALTNRTLSAREALDWGLVTAVVADGELERAAEALAGRLAGGAPQALGGAKRLLHGSFGESLAAQMDHEQTMIQTLAGTDDGREGIGAFLAKRPPRFTGS